jgi:hypothetical protein
MPHGWLAIRDASLLATVLAVAILLAGMGDGDSHEAAAWMAMGFGERQLTTEHACPMNGIT